MKNTNTYLEELKSGALNGRMIEIYGCDEKKAQEYADRFAGVIRGFTDTFPDNAQAEIGLYSAPGRTEIGGNHTGPLRAHPRRSGEGIHSRPDPRHGSSRCAERL